MTDSVSKEDTPSDGECFINTWSSRVCELGTKSCIMVHHSAKLRLLTECEAEVRFAMDSLPVSDPKTRLNRALLTLGKLITLEQIAGKNSSS